MPTVRMIGLLGLAMGSLLTAQAQGDDGPSQCEVFCHFGTAAQKEECGCGEIPMTTGRQETSTSQPQPSLPQPSDNSDYWDDGVLTSNEVYEAAKAYYIGAMEGAETYTATISNNISPVNRTAYMKKEYFDGVPSFKELNIEELNTLVLQNEADQASAVAAANPGSGAAAKTAEDAQAIAQIDPNEFLGVLGEAARIVKEEGGQDPEAGPIIDALDPLITDIEVLLHRAENMSGEQKESDREAAERDAVLDVVDFGAAEREIFWDHPTLTMGVGIYDRNSARFIKLDAPCSNLTGEIVERCQTEIRNRTLDSYEVLCIVLESEPEYLIRDPDIEGSYTIKKAEKWIEASMLMVGIQSFGSLGEYKAARGVKTRFEVISTEANGFSEIVVERMTEHYQRFDELELPTTVIDRVTGVSSSPRDVATKVSDVQVNPPLPTRAEMAQQFMGAE